MSARTHAAVQGFNLAADAYERGRPEYPEAAIAFLAEAMAVPQGGLVVDLGAGTGKLTRALDRWPVRRVAIEPTPAMRTEFRHRLPEVPLLAAVAEAIPIRTGAADGVVVGQAFHWFRQPESYREIARVLGPTGHLGLIWNLRDESLPWTKRLARLIESETGGIPRSRSAEWKKSLEGASEFGPLEPRTFPHVQRADVSTVVDRVLSISTIALLPGPRRQAIAAEVRRILAEEPETAGRTEVELPYSTTVYWAPRSRV